VPQAAPTYEIQGREVSLPVHVRDAFSASATFAVSSAAARRLLPGPEIDVAEIAPGRCLLSVAAIDYRDNDLGDYDEVSIAFFVRPRGAKPGLPWLGTWVDLVRGRLGTYIRHLPVNQEFTREAGCRIWGFPKTVQGIDLERSPDEVRCRLEVAGEHALTLAVRPPRRTRELPDSDLVTYSWIEGAPHATRFTSGARAFGARVGGARLELGAGPLAEELRSLRPGRALFTAVMDGMHARFDAPDKL